MHKVILVASACCLTLSGAAVAGGYKLDAGGKCRDDHNKFTKQEMCKAAIPAHFYKFDAKKKCRDDKGHFVEDKFCKA